LLPFLIFLLTRSACRSLRRSASHPLRDWQGTVVRRHPDGGVEVMAQSEDGYEPTSSEPPVGTVPGHEDPEDR